MGFGEEQSAQPKHRPERTDRKQRQEEGANDKGKRKTQERKP